MRRTGRALGSNVATRALALAAVGVVLSVALVACSPGRPAPAATTPPAPAPTSPGTPAPSTSATSNSPSTLNTSKAAPSAAEVLVYLTREDQLAVAGPREAPADAPAMGALITLLAGPSAREAQYGLSTAIPSATQLGNLRIGSGLAMVDLSPPFASPAPSAVLRERLAQVVYTLTQFPTVSRVSFTVGGKRLDELGGIDLTKPLGRPDFEQQLPPIMVNGPLPGAKVSSPLLVTGSADVVEAQFQVQLYGPDGKAIAGKLVKAISGTGTRGAFAATLRFKNAMHGAGRLVAFERSAKDGSPVNMVQIPVQF